MKKRLRKKLRKGEFAEYGFKVKITYDLTLNSTKADLAFDQLITLVESLDLRILGCFVKSKFDGLVFKHRGSCTDEDIANFTKLAYESKVIKLIETSKLLDINK